MMFSAASAYSYSEVNSVTELIVDFRVLLTFVLIDWENLLIKADLLPFDLPDLEVEAISS